MRDLSTTYGAIHKHLQKHFRKAGQCVRCERTDCRTEFALISGREYSRDREDYLELCVPCHRRYDGNLPPVRRGEDSPSAKLTVTIVIEARQAFASGEHSGRDLARKYGVDARAMQRAINGETWKHVPAYELLARADHIFDAAERACSDA
jgi:hypothetical protein